MAKIGITGLWLAGMFALNPCALLHAQGVANTTVTVDSMNLPGADAAALAARAGWWDVSETVWARPGAEPAVIHGQVAHRQMVGLYLQEMLYASAQRSDAALHRMDYLGYNRVTGRWEYLSMDTRVAAGLMPAWSYEHDDVRRIRIQFEPFAFPGAGATVSGQLLRMEEIIEQTGPDTETKDQYFILADGSGTKWLAHRYAYARRKGGL
ncbi:Protein of unknown function [Duganella sacchari]|uniref:Peptidoglycan-binding protein, CsiV n=1 Tax=Duganella sacchari TaxID=551987 RepID=A0A1M7QJV9_9BURK|nr:DUF1579 family protein [Duganella sacchari]SHN31321.1 Protein of unknown function [Duganella sacchari]